MIFIKTTEEVELIRMSSIIASEALAEIAKILKPGMSTLALNEMADEFIRDHNALPSFLNENGYPFSICTSLNSVIMHGFPREMSLKEGDVLSVNLGVYKNEFHGDCAYTFIIGEATPEIMKLVRVTKEALYRGIAEANSEQHLGNISSAIKHYIEGEKCMVIKELGGHAIGRSLWELPEVSNNGRRGEGIELQENLVLAVEPIASLTTNDYKDLDNGFSTRTADKSTAAHFGHTIVVQTLHGKPLTDFAPIEYAEQHNANLNVFQYN